MNLDYTAAAKIAIALQDELDPQQVGQAIMRGVNKSAVGIRAQITKRLGSDFNAPAKAIKAALPIQKATFREPEAVIQIDGASIPMVEFLLPASKRELEAKARGKDGALKPPRVKIFKGKAAITLTHAFYEPQGKYIAERVDKGVGSGRGPLKGQYGPSIASQAKKIMEDIEPWAQENTRKRVEEELNYQLIKVRKKLENG